MAGFDQWATIRRYTDKTAKRGILFELTEDLAYHSLDGESYMVKAGFISDLGSVPRLAWFLCPPHSRPSAYILHDMFCEDEDYSRKFGDDMLLEALRLSHAPGWKAKLIYWSVRAYAILVRKE